MGIWEEYCLICGGPLNDTFTLFDEENDVEEQITKKEYKWMYQLFILTSENEIIKTTYNNYELSGFFEIGSKEYITTPAHYTMLTNPRYGTGNTHYGVVCHRDCYHLIQKKLKHDIVFANVCRLLDKYNSLLKPKSKYKPMDKFIQQFYEYALIIKNHSWLLESPLKNKQNEQRILNLWTPLVNRFKKTPPRNSPCESATDFNQGTVRKGFDGNDYIVKAYNGVKKWVPYDPEQDSELVSKLEEQIRKPRRMSKRKRKRRGSSKRKSRRLSKRKSRRSSKRKS